MKKLLIVSFLLYANMFAGSNVLSSEGGRYVFGQISDMARDQFMLDTKTGRLWQVVVDQKENISLSPVPISVIEWDKNGKANFFKTDKPTQ